MHVEDIQSDADIVKREMKRCELPFEWLWVTNKSDFVAALKNYSPDLVLCDHSLPGFSSSDAFLLLKNSGLNIPFILITATMSEEFAVAMMKEGIADYLLKDRLQRLPEAVINALEKWQARKQKEAHQEEILKNERRFRGLIENSNDLKHVLDKNFKPIYSSPNLERITGWTKKEIKEEGLLKIVHPEDLETVKSTLAQAIANPDKIIPLTYRCQHKNDKYIWLEGTLINKLNDEAIQGIIANSQDVTQQKKTETSLRDYNERFEILSRATNDAIWDWDIDQDTIKWNHGIETIFGYRYLDVDGGLNWWKEKIHPTDRQLVQQRIESVFQAREVNHTWQCQLLCANGAYKYVLNRAFVIYKEDKPVRMIGAMQDVTAQKDFERNIIDIARELSELIENANTPIFGTDKSMYINEWNKITASLTGYSKNEVLGKPITDFIRPDYKESFKLVLTRVSEGEPVSDLQLPIIAKGNQDIITLINATPRKNSSQELKGILIVGQNITELIEYRQNLEMKVLERTRELNEALSKEKELVEIKSRFVSIASHEFRTPLSTISLVSGFLRKHHEKISNEEFDNKLKSIEKQVNNMTFLLEDILMIGKTDAGKIQIQYKPININQFFRLIAKEVEESAKTHVIHVNIKTTIKEFDADEKLLRNIIINLLTNAIKFSPGENSISLHITDSKNYLKIEVEDEGVGISEEDQKNMFTAFHRGSNVGDISGTGLGLSIVKKAIDLLAGNIEIKSSLDQGTHVIVTLPLR